MSKSFWLARRSDGHRFEGSHIKANNTGDAERQFFDQLRYNPRELIVVGAQR